MRGERLCGGSKPKERTAGELVLGILNRDDIADEYACSEPDDVAAAGADGGAGMVAADDTNSWVNGSSGR
jgi:hypothetical protein